MNAPVKLVAFGAVLAASFGVGLAVGAVAGPLDTGEQHRPEDLPTPSSIVHEEGHGDGDG